MRPIAYINGKVLQKHTFLSGQAVVVDDSVIVDIVPTDELVQDTHEIVDLNGHYLLPGFIDTQVNGGGGVLFNDAPDIDGIKTIVKAHRQFGTTGMLLTLISDELDAVQKGISAVNTAIETGVPGVLGIHIEGPFLNIDKRGIHDATKIRKLTAGIVNELEPVKGGVSVLTIAPETMDPALIRGLKDKGFVICAGHTNATYAETSTAIDHGVTGFTHLFNAMSQLGAREPGVVGAALDHHDTWCGVIADGVHVSGASLRIAYRCKGPEKLMLVTDAMPPVGSSENEFILMGNRITAKDGVCIDAKGTLAGTALDMASAVRNMMKLTDCSLAEASIMASTSPASFLGLEKRTGSIKVGMLADFVVLNEQLNIVEVFNSGR
jgi:N-acetylglucosamine-6-phosphate deacetylase